MRVGADAMAYLIDLYNSKAVKRATEFGECAEQLEIAALEDGYTELLSSAPRRSVTAKPYFGGRAGITGGGGLSNRSEEHLAVALYNASRSGKRLAMPDGRTLDLLDYQTPLKARRADPGVGKIDLLGRLENEIPAIIELKVAGRSGRLADTPLRALLEGLAYCAMFEADGAAIAAEADDKLDCRLAVVRPALIVMAPEEYWSSFLFHSRTGDWLPAVLRVVEGIRSALGLEVHLVALRDAGFEMSRDGKPPRLIGDCSLVSQNAVEQQSSA